MTAYDPAVEIYAKRREGLVPHNGVDDTQGFDVAVQIVSGGAGGGTSLNETLWTDDTGAFYVRVDNGTTISWKDISGAAAVAPGTGARPAAGPNTIADRVPFRANATGTGYTVGDLIDHYVILDPATGAVLSAFWINSTTNAKLTAAPASANLTPIGATSDATAANQATQITLLQSLVNDNSAALVIGQANVKTATFTRPANVTAYTAGQLMGNTGTVIPMNWTVAAANGGTGMIRKVRIRKTSTNITNASFRVHLFSVAPTTIPADGAAFTGCSGMANYVGAFDVTVDRQLSDGSVGSGAPHTGTEVTYQCAANDVKLYGLVEVLGAYTPDSSGGINVDLEFWPNSLVA